jgi:hypothetical protein
MKTRSGFLYRISNWPEAEDYSIPDFQQRYQLLAFLAKSLREALNNSVWDRKIAVLVSVESIIKYEIFFTDEEFQKFLNAAIKKLTEATGSDNIKGYIRKLMTRSDYHKKEAQRKYIHSIVKCSFLGPDIADKVSEFV